MMDADEYDGSGSTDTDKNYRDFANVLDYRHYDTPVYSDITSVCDDVNDKVDAPTVDINHNELDKTPGEFGKGGVDLEDSGVDTDVAKLNENDNSNSSLRSTPSSARSIKRIRYALDLQDSVPNNKIKVLIKNKKKGKNKAVNGDVGRSKDGLKDKNRSKANISGVNQTSESNGSVKLPNLTHRCQHFQSAMLDRAGKVKKWTRGKKIPDDETYRCVLCEIREASENNESNKIISEIVYPHTFYDKFQRSKKKSNTNSTKAPAAVKESIPICKQQKLSPRLARREKTTVAVVRESEELSTDSSSSSVNTNPHWETSYLDTVAGENRAKLSDINNKVHENCKYQNRAVVVYESDEGTKPAKNGWKGSLTKKDPNASNKSKERDLKKSLYKVNSLGIKFCIPEYNESLGDRVQQLQNLPRPPTTSYTHAQENHQLRRGSKANSSPPRDYHNTSRNNSNPQLPPREIGRLERSYTLPPKLLTDTIPEVVSRDNKQDGHVDTSPKQQGLTGYKQHSRFSLPPLGFNYLSRSLTINNF